MLIIDKAIRITGKQTGWSEVNGAAIHEDAKISDKVSFAADCIVAGGVFYDGYFGGGYFHGGVFHGGYFHGGVFHGGYFRGGDFHGGVFHGGVFHDGEFRGGVFYGGVWQRSPVFVQGTRYSVAESDADYICSGCLRLRAEDWTADRIRLEATTAGYTAEQVKEYAVIFQTVKQLIALHFVKEDSDDETEDENKDVQS